MMSVPCPKCDDETSWVALQDIVVMQPLDGLAWRDQSGEIEAKFDFGCTVGHEVISDELIGLQCANCGFEVRGTTAEMAEKIFPQPDIEALLALSRRLKQ